MKVSDLLCHGAVTLFERAASKHKHSKKRELSPSDVSIGQVNKKSWAVSLFRVCHY